MQSADHLVPPVLRSQEEACVDALPKALNEVQRLLTGIEQIAQQRLTPPKTRAQLRFLAAGVDWRKAK